MTYGRDLMTSSGHAHLDASVMVCRQRTSDGGRREFGGAFVYEVYRPVETFIFLRFSKNDPYVKIFKTIAIIQQRQREIGEFVRCLLEKKKQNFASLFSSRYCANRAQNLPRPAPDNVLRVLQISSKSVYFQRSYTQRVNTIKTGRSVSNIGLYFEPKE